MLTVKPIDSWIRRSRPRNQPAFTLIEVLVVTSTMAFIAMLIAGIWSELARSSTSNIDQARLVSAAQLAVESFRRDLAGYAPEKQNGDKLEGVIVGKLITNDGRLLLCFDGEPTNESPDWATPDTVITYEIQSGQLVRSNQQTGTAFVVADDVSNFNVTQLYDGVKIELTLERGDFTRTYTLISKDP